jgi:hypothetical protein
MYHILKIYTIIFSILLSKKINSKMVKSEIVMLIEREKVDADELQPAWVRGREKANVAWTRIKYNQMTTETSLRCVLEAFLCLVSYSR